MAPIAAVCNGNKSGSGMSSAEVVANIGMAALNGGGEPSTENGISQNGHQQSSAAGALSSSSSSSQAQLQQTTIVGNSE